MRRGRPASQPARLCSFTSQTGTDERIRGLCVGLSVVGAAEGGGSYCQAPPSSAVAAHNRVSVNFSIAKEGLHLSIHSAPLVRVSFRSLMCSPLLALALTHFHTCSPLFALAPNSLRVVPVKSANSHDEHSSSTSSDRRRLFRRSARGCGKPGAFRGVPVHGRSGGRQN